MIVLNGHHVGHSYFRGRPFHSGAAASFFSPDCHTVHSSALYGATAQESEQGWYWYETGGSRGYVGPFASEQDAIAHAQARSR